MNILSKTRKEIEDLVKGGFLREETLKHYDVCKELQNGATAQAISDKFNISDGRLVRYIKQRKCPDCGRKRPQ